MSAFSPQTLIQLSYLVVAFLFIVGLKRMSSPLTAASGIRWAGLGMVLATVATLLFMGASTTNLVLVIAAIAIGGAIAWISGKRVAMTDMPRRPRLRLSSCSKAAQNTASHTCCWRLSAALLAPCRSAAAQLHSRNCRA
jgi:NAD/NADP transhydrogenase beta subunit